MVVVFPQQKINCHKNFEIYDLFVKCIASELHSGAGESFWKVFMLELNFKLGDSSRDRVGESSVLIKCQDIKLK